MGFYGYEQPVEYGKRQVFDPTTANMVLQAQQAYAAALQKEYYRNIEEQKEFQEKYGDFITPIAKDQAWVQENFNDPIRNAVNEMYEHGINPLTNRQAMAELERIRRNLPYQEFAFKKERAENAKQYYKNMAALRAAGKYDETWSRFLGEDPSQWADDFAGVTSPTQFQTLKEATADWFNNRTAGELNKADVEAFGMAYDPRNKYIGFGQRQLLDIAAGNTPGWNGSVYAKYYRDQAKRQLQAAGIDNPTPELIEKQLQNNIATANREYLITPTAHADQWKLLEQQHKNSIALQDRKRQYDSQTDYPLTLTERTKSDALDIQDIKSAKKMTFKQMQQKYGKRVYNDKTKKWYIQLDDNFYQALADNYDAYQVTPRDDDQDHWASLLWSGNNKRKMPGTEETRNVVKMGDKDVHLTRNREMAYAGGKFTHNSSTNKFERYLKERNVTAYSDDNMVTVNWNKQGGVSVYDVNTKVLVPYNKIGGFFKGKTEEQTKVQLQQLGIRLIDTYGKEIDPNDAHKMINSNKVQAAQYSITRTVGGFSGAESSINTSQTKEQLGVSTASKRQGTIQEDALEDE